MDSLSRNYEMKKLNLNVRKINCIRMIWAIFKPYLNFLHIFVKPETNYRERKYLMFSDSFYNLED